MTKQKREADTFFMTILSVVVILAGFLVITRFLNEPNPRVEGASTVRGDSSRELLKSLDSTVDDGGAADFAKLERDARGL